MYVDENKFVFFSENNMLLIKSINNKELEFLKKNLGKYCQHLWNNSTSLLAKIYGMFSIKYLGYNYT